MATSVKKPAAKKAAAQKQGVQGATAPKPQVAVVMEVKHRMLGIFWHTHHLVSVMDASDMDSLEFAAKAAAREASKTLPGIKCRVVCVEKVSKAMGTGIPPELKEVLASL